MNHIKSTRIIIADDHQMFRQGLRLMLQSLPGVEVIAEAEDGLTAVKLAQQLLPDVVVMDVAMPGLNGIEATRQVMDIGYGPKVIALSGRAGTDNIKEMLRAGAAGFVRKESAFNELAEALRTVVADRIYVSPAIAEIVAEHGHNGNGRLKNALSQREREVLHLMAEGRATKEIARELHVSVKTVETHRRNLMLKLDLHSVAELTKYAIRQGITSLEV